MSLACVTGYTVVLLLHRLIIAGFTGVVHLLCQPSTASPPASPSIHPCSPGFPNTPMPPPNFSLVRSVQNTLRLTLAHASPAAAFGLRVLPRLAKLIAYLLLILNFRSLPFGWHSMFILVISCSQCSSYFFFLQSAYFGQLSRSDGMRGVLACARSPSPPQFAMRQRASSSTASAQSARIHSTKP